MKKKKRDYSMIKKDDAPKVEPVRKRIFTSNDIDFKVFQKSKAEKLMLKMAKAHSKINLK